MDWNLFYFWLFTNWMRGDQLIPSHYKNLVVRFMNHNGALSWIICFWHSKLFSIMTILFQLNSSEVGKSKKKIRNKKFGGVIIRHIDRLFFGLFRLISVKFKSLMYRDYCQGSYLGPRFLVRNCLKFSKNFRNFKLLKLLRFTQKQINPY